jgi:hypothetical protein
MRRVRGPERGGVHLSRVSSSPIADLGEAVEGALAQPADKPALPSAVDRTAPALRPLRPPRRRCEAQLVGVPRARDGAYGGLTRRGSECEAGRVQEGEPQQYEPCKWCRKLMCGMSATRQRRPRRTGWSIRSVAWSATSSAFSRMRMSQCRLGDGCNLYAHLDLKGAPINANHAGTVVTARPLVRAASFEA